MGLRFKRTIEDFLCAHCGVEVKGSGYTNHCPKCLWSRHVDVFPGDRENPCGGMMRPIKLITEHDDFLLIHRCEKCGEEKRIKMNENDDMSVALKIKNSI